MIGHHHTGVQIEVPEIAGGVMPAIEDHLGNVLTLEPGGAEGSLIQIAIHPHEGVAGGEAWGREPISRQTAVQTPGDE